MAAGDPVLASDAARLVARGTLAASKSGISTTETGVLRLDDVPVFDRKCYFITTTSANVDCSVASDIGDLRLRVKQGTVTGGTAGITDTEIAHLRVKQTDTALGDTVPMTGFYAPSADGYLSILVSLLRVSGTGTFALNSGAGEQFTLMVWESDDPGDTGVSL